MAGPGAKSGSTLPALATALAVSASAPANAAGVDRGGVPFGAVAIALVIFAGLFFGLWLWFYHHRDIDSRIPPPAPAPVTPSPPAPAEPSITLAGFDTDGSAARCVISRRDAGRGVIIGRAKRNGPAGKGLKRFDLSHDDRVSRDHIKIDHDGSGFRATDLGSLNNSKLNGKQMTPNTAHRLGQNDQLELGEALLLHVTLNLFDGEDR